MKIIKEKLNLTQEEQAKVCKLYKRIQFALNTQNQSNKPYLQELLIQTIQQVPEVLYVVDGGKNMLDIIVENKFWDTLEFVSNYEEFVDLVNIRLGEFKKTEDQIKC